MFKVKSDRDQEYFEFRVKLEFGPKASKHLRRFGIDAVNKGLTGIHELGHGQMTMIASDLFAQPAPETFNRIEVRAVAGQRL